VTVKYVSTRRVPIEKLTPFPGNARRGNVEELRASIRRHGQYRALVVRDMGDGELVILAGNHTSEALTLEGHTAARCEIVTCDDDEALRINLADNRLSDLGEYDDVSLVDQLSQLAGDLEGIGYTADDLHRLMTGTKPSTAEPPDEFPKVDEGIAVDYGCPRCGYEWSGNPKPTAPRKEGSGAGAGPLAG